MILGLDTSAGQCATALVGDGRVWRRAEVMARGHAEALFPMIEAVLADAGVGYDAVTRIAVCTGPGSFTGVRAAVAAARGLALGLGVPAVGVSRLAALADGAGEGAVEVAVPLRGTSWAVQAFGPDGAPLGDPRIEERGPCPEDGFLPDPAAIARLGARADAGVRPAPLYLRPADAAPSSEAPPRMLD